MKQRAVVQIVAVIELDGKKNDVTANVTIDMSRYPQLQKDIAKGYKTMIRQGIVPPIVPSS